MALAPLRVPERGLCCVPLTQTDGSDHELNINPSVSCLPEEPTVVSALLQSCQSVITQSA